MCIISFSEKWKFWRENVLCVYIVFHLFNNNKILDNFFYDFYPKTKPMLYLFSSLLFLKKYNKWKFLFEKSLFLVFTLHTNTQKLPFKKIYIFLSLLFFIVSCVFLNSRRNRKIVRLFIYFFELLSFCCIVTNKKEMIWRSIFFLNFRC